MKAAVGARAFLVGFAAAVIGCGVLVFATNLVVDPFWIFNLLTIPGINGQRAEVPNQARMTKAQMVCRLQPTAVAIGSSRVEVGIDPRYPAWGNRPNETYNLGLAGTGLDELFLTLQHAVHASPSLRLVVVGLDFFMFNANRESVVFGTEVLDFDRQRLMLSPSDTCLRSFLHDSSELVGPQGLAYDLATIRAQLPDADRHTLDHQTYWGALYERDGFRGNEFGEAENNVALRYGFRNLIDGPSGTLAGQEAYYVSRIWLPPPDQRYCFSRSGQPDTMNMFRQIVEFARKSKIDIRFMINPIHARMLIALQEAGLWPQYEDWKRGLVSILAEDATQHQTTAFPLWDFSGFNSVTTERIPPTDDRSTSMNWWWEPSHFQQAAGDLMLDRVLDYQKDLPSVPKDFGILLQPSNIENWIEHNRVAGRDYRRAQPGEIKVVTDRVDPLLADSEGTSCGSYIDVLREASTAVRRGESAAAAPLFARAIAIDEEGRRRAAELGMPYREAGFATFLAEARAGTDIPANLANWEAYQTRGNQRAGLGDLPGAIDDYGRAIRIGPRNTALYYLRGTTRLAVGDRSGAAADFEAGLKLDPTNTTLQQLFVQAQAPVSDPVAAKRLQDQADSARTQGDLTSAIQLYGDAIAVSPPNTALYYLRGTARLEFGDRSGAAADFEAGLKLDPKNATLQQLLAQAQATASERAAVQEAPRDPGAAKRLQDQADAARVQGDLTSAIRLYGEAIAVSPPNTALYYLRGTARLEFGDRSGAATDFEAGLKLDPKNTTLQQLLAQAQATASERAAVQEAPRDPGAAKRLQDQADAARAQGDLTSAIRLYGEAMAVSPPNTALYYLRGTARLEFGDRSGAAADFEAGLKLDPTNPALQQLLAQAQAAGSRQGQQ